MKYLLLILTAILINTVAIADDTCKTYSDEWGNVLHQNEHCEKDTKHTHVNFHTCTVKGNHICTDNSCHAESCTCNACDNDAVDNTFRIVIGVLFGFMILILVIFAIQSGMFNIKTRY